MIAVHCRTNIDDVMSRERFPTRLPACPTIGQTIQSGTVWKNGCQVEFKVVNVIWKESLTGNHVPRGEWYAMVELHHTGEFPHLGYFHAWYKLIQGRMTDEEYREEIKRLDSKNTIANR